MSTILKSQGLLASLLLLCAFECGVFGLADSGNSLLGPEPVDKLNREDIWRHRKRRSAEYAEQRGSERSRRAQESDDLGLNDLNYTSEEATESPAGVEAQVLQANGSVTVSVGASFAPTPSAAVQQAVSSVMSRPLVQASSYMSAFASISLTVQRVSIQPTQSSIQAKFVSESVTVTSEKPQLATSSVMALASAKWPTRTISIGAQSSHTVVAPTQQGTTTARKTTADVDANADPTEQPKETLFGFVTLEILIALLAGAACAVILVAFLVYRLRKRNEGSYELCEMVNYSDTYTGKDGEKEVFV